MGAKQLAPMTPVIEKVSPDGPVLADFAGKST
jgi:hypothetical protein